MVPRLFYAQCPVSAGVALRARRPGLDKVAFAIHFNRSQATEWADRGFLVKGDRLWRAIADLEAQALQRVDGLVYASQFMRRFTESRLASLHNKPAMVGANFLDTPTTEPVDTQHLGRDLIAVGSLEPRKNQSYLLQVLAVAQAHGRKLSLTMVGDGQDRKALIAEVRRLGLASQVRLLGERHDVGALLRAHKLFVHSARMESLGIVLIEAMARGRPVVAGAVGGVPEIFDDGIEGCVWPLDDPEASASVLLHLLDNWAARERMGAAARRRFETQFHTAVAAPRLLAFLDSLMAPAGSRSISCNP
jgi:glycosyltransferase involved in cell wall biosynthesis